MITATQRITAHGHPMILGTHPTTFEVTREEELTRAGNCIIAVGADTGCADLNSPLRTILSRGDAVLVTTLICEGIEVAVTSRGSSLLSFDDPHDMVWRRSGYVCGRTIGIYSSATAQTLPREMIHKLQAGAPILILLVASIEAEGSLEASESG